MKLKGLILVLIALLTGVTLTQATVTNAWVGDGTSVNASESVNWSLGHVPSTAAGGAIRLIVAGDTTVDGTIHGLKTFHILDLSTCGMRYGLIKSIIKTRSER
ncbi:MAG: hypothetical protein PF692_05015 [Kiritimatiellae bacterium]|jgi:hypothetical protein|nr:hypothetical protein [Kiritimatiellia bacterium]